MKEHVIVVTGANRGIGLEICHQLAKLDLIVVRRCPGKQRQTLGQNRTQHGAT